ncbi:hypothetical protein KVR01_008352 [Diaporthe batatas]|uniref:uncharacterized protein n=1 Tax=Diaporthe batatas TaxID=748121 RepID=UPI001D05007F|nr:uncharacterized protein KVR01_008352 [Diaporthe batatas]KAG8162587.1 hypothetical protein KVR01_008352 [Diaporthe batatas]
MTDAYNKYYHNSIAGHSGKVDQLAYTLAARRSLMPWRTYAVIGDTCSDPARSQFIPADPIRIPMEDTTLLRYPAFRESLQRSDEILATLGCDWSILSELQRDHSVTRPKFSQPLCTALQIALVALLEAFGIAPAAVVGHSSGEIAAAYAAGGLSQESACKVAYFRGQVAEMRLTTSIVPEAMISVNISETDCEAFLQSLHLQGGKHKVHIACVNSPSNITLSGPEASIDFIKDHLQQQDVFSKKINTGIAYHSPDLHAMANEYRSLMGSLVSGSMNGRRHRIPMISSVTNHTVGSEVLSTAQYWIDNLVSPVRFYEAMRTLTCNIPPSEHVAHPGQLAITDIIEVGPTAALRRPVRDSVPLSLRYHSVLDRTRSSLQTTLKLVGTLFCHGYGVSITAANLQSAGSMPFLVDCPSYPFDHSRRYWSESRLSKEMRLRPRELGYMLGRRAHDLNTLRPRWRNWLSIETMPWLEDHVVSGTTLCPGAGLVVMAIEAVKETAAASNQRICGVLLKDAKFMAPVIVGKTMQTTSETVLHLRHMQNANEKRSRWYEIEIFSYRDDRWTECFRATCQAQTDAHSWAELDGGREDRLEHDQIRQRCSQATASCTEPVARQQFYASCKEYGIEYGSSFQLLQDICWDGRTMSTARVDMPNVQGDPASSPDPTHPTVLDAGMHLLLVQISKGLSGRTPTLVPHRVGKAWISTEAWDSTPLSLRVTSYLHSAMADDTSNAHRGSLWALNEGGSTVFTVEDVVFAEVSRPQDENKAAGRTLLYNITWRPQLSSLSIDDQSLVINEARKVFDESFEESWASKSELAMRLVARHALRDMNEEQLANAPVYMRRYTAALRHHYATPRYGEVEFLSDSALASLLDECEEENPECRVFMQVGRALPSIIRGQTNPLEVMFTTKSAEELYRYLAMHQLRDGRFEAFLDLATYEKPGLSILEVGAGTGSLTKHILGALERFESETGQVRFSSYTYTDVSPSFFGTARDDLGDFQGRLVFKVLDLENDPDSQLFEPESYDLVVAGLVLHAVADVQKTLARIRQLVKPGGYLAFQEVVFPESACANVTFGSLEGWWLSSEDWRHEQHTPLLTEERWDNILLDSGFSGADLVLRDHQSPLCHLCSMLISKAVTVAQDQPEKLLDSKETTLRLLIDSNSDTQRSLAEEITERCSTIQTLEMDVNLGEELNSLPKDVVIVSLLEVGTPRLASLSEPDFQALEQLVQNTQNMLWVGCLPKSVDGMFDPHTALATGLFRGIQSEEPSKHIVTLVIESEAPSTSSKFIFDVLSACFWQSPASIENEFVVRNGCLNVGRLAKQIVLDSERLSRVERRERKEAWRGSGPSVYLEVGTPGMMDSLRFVEDPVLKDGLDSNEVEIEAVAWPVSFRDIFVALGRLGMQGLGVECAGAVTRVGQSCSYHFRPGDRVVMVALGCMRSHPRAASDVVVRIPESLSYHAAVSAINPGMTAYHSLVNIARLQAGEKVLIHSGAGSTGQMAIAIATWLGAEVFTTVSSKSKKTLLIDLFNIREDHIFYSRDTSFAKGIMRVTDGYGVDVVLNSLSGEGLRASWECIAAYGRFIEIGKADIETNSTLPMGQFSRNVMFAAVDLVHISQTNRKLLRQLIEKILDMVAHGDIHGPSPLDIYPVSDVERAFRCMQSGKNTGRIIVTGDPVDIVSKYVVDRSQWTFDANSSYVVPGGFGGIGRAILRWMVDRGARYLIVPSRSGPSSQDALDVVSDLKSKGVCMVNSPCDVTSVAELSALVQNCTANMPPIKGCINAVMVLQDTMFRNMTHTQWSTAVQAKVKASWNLHQLLPQNMDFFVLLSSLGGIYGSPGQSNYAAGCAFQDALARSRSAIGCRGSVSIDIGWMRTIGVIAETERYQRTRKNAGDMSEVEEADFFAVLDHYCDPSLPVLTVDQSQMLIGVFTQADYYARGETPIEILGRPLFAGFSTILRSQCSGPDAAAVTTNQDVATLFRNAESASERSGVVVQGLRAKLAGALGISVEDVDPRRSLFDYGTDSLMAVELRNWIRRSFGVSVPVFNIMDGATIGNLGDQVAKLATI